MAVGHHRDRARSLGPLHPHQPLEMQPLPIQQAQQLRGLMLRHL